MMAVKINRNKFIIITALIFSVVLLSSNVKMNKGIKVGDKAPLFNLMDQHGEEFFMKDYLGLNAMVVYFYPKDDTPGCTKEACKFRDDHQEFEELKVKIIGISADSVESHKDFAIKYNLPFTLLADTNNEVRNLFGVKKNFFGLVPGRVTYVIDINGVVIHIYDNMIKSENHINEALKALAR